MNAMTVRKPDYETAAVIRRLTEDRANLLAALKETVAFLRVAENHVPLGALCDYGDQMLRDESAIARAFQPVE